MAQGACVCPHCARVNPVNIPSGSGTTSTSCHQPGCYKSYWFRYANGMVVQTGR